MQRPALAPTRPRLISIRGALRSLTVAVFLALFTVQLYSQSAGTADAKQHYQNAVAAIAKSDWQTAKNELLQAEKLAPQNALVHYDLALAYSHTGQSSHAQTEVTKSLQLGLPADQEKAARSLKAQLAAQSAQVHPSQNSAKAVAPPDNLAPAQDDTIRVTPSNVGVEPSSPTIEETISYLNERVDSSFVHQNMHDYVPGKFSISSDWRTIWWSRRMSIAGGFEVLFASAKVDDVSPNDITFDPKSWDLVIDCKVAACWDKWILDSPVDEKDDREWLLTAQIDAGMVTWPKFKTHTATSKQATLQGQQHGIAIPTNGDRETAGRFMRALQHLVRLLQALPENQAPDDPFAR